MYIHFIIYNIFNILYIIRLTIPGQFKPSIAVAIVKCKPDVYRVCFKDKRLIDGTLDVISTEGL